MKINFKYQYNEGRREREIGYSLCVTEREGIERKREREEVKLISMDKINSK